MCVYVLMLVTWVDGVVIGWSCFLFLPWGSQLGIYCRISGGAIIHVE